MDIPKTPTILPHARRFTRRFATDQSRIFAEGDTVSIQIPPTDKTYLTKNVKLHFKVKLQFEAYGQDEATIMVLDMLDYSKAYRFINDPTYVPTATVAQMDYLYSVFPQTNQDLNAYWKVVPVMDINGPYGFIESIQVCDFLGGTVLEDIPYHHLLTAQFADCWFKDDNLSINRPRVVDAYTGKVRKPAVVPFPEYYPDYITTPTPLDLQYEAGTGKLTVDVEPEEITREFEIDLYSMLHRLSTVFVPLHNGYTIHLKLRNPLTYETMLEQRSVVYVRQSLGSGTNPQEITTFRNGYMLPLPNTKSLSFQDIYLNADLLELHQDLDDQIDKIVQYEGWKYQMNFLPPAANKRPDFTQRLFPQLKSVNKVFVGQRLTEGTMYGSRVRNNLDKAELTYNKAVVNSLQQKSEFLAAWSREGPDSYLDASDFFVNVADADRMLFVPDYIREKGKEELQNIKIGTQAAYPGDAAVTAVQYAMNPVSPDGYKYDFSYLVDALLDQGRFLCVFDCKIPSTSSEVVSGVDTTRNTLEYRLQYGSVLSQNVVLDAFLEHDARLRVNPGKDTTVSF
jgi:hypothetical protein